LLEFLLQVVTYLCSPCHANLSKLAAKFGKDASVNHGSRIDYAAKRLTENKTRSDVTCMRQLTASRSSQSYRRDVVGPASLRLTQLCQCGVCQLLPLSLTLYVSLCDHSSCAPNECDITAEIKHASRASALSLRRGVQSVRVYGTPAGQASCRLITLWYLLSSTSNHTCRQSHAAPANAMFTSIFTSSIYRT